MSKFTLKLAILLLVFIWATPVFAEGVNNPAVPSQNVVVENTETGGLQPISAEKLQSKISTLEAMMVNVMSPVMHLMSKMMLILVGVLLFVAVFMRDMFGKIFLLVGSVILGMVIFTNVGPITDTIQYLGQWLNQ